MLTALLAATTGGLSSDAAVAQTAPSLLIIAPGPEGGGFDRAARAVGKALEQAALASPVTYENVGAAGGVTALPRLAEASAARPGVLMITGAVMVGASVSTGGDLLARVTPIARLAVDPLAIAVPSAGPANIAALVEALRTPAGAVIAGGPNGSPDHLLLLAIASALSLPDGRAVYQPHSGGRPAAESVLAGNAAAVLTNWSDLVPFVVEGKLRVIATTDLPPNAAAVAPTLRDAGIAVSGGNWRGLVAGPNIAAAERNRLIAMTEALARSEPWRQELAQRRWVDSFLGGDAFAAFLADDIARVRAAVGAAPRPAARP